MSETRRHFFQNLSAVCGGLALVSLMTKEAAAKIKPELIGYQPTPKDGHDCAGCKLFEPPNACKNVDGVISPQGWCKIWLKA